MSLPSGVCQHAQPLGGDEAHLGGELPGLLDAIREVLGQATIDAVKVNDPRIANDDFEIKDQRIYIRADAGLEYRNVVRVMNRLQDQGFTKIGFVAEDRRM